jgi:hypothetical protein
VRSLLALDGDIAVPEPPLRFVVEVEHYIVTGLIGLGFLGPDKGDDLLAILAGLKRLGWKASISRIA